MTTTTTKQNQKKWKKEEVQKGQKIRSFDQNLKEKKTTDCMLATLAPLKFNYFAHNNETVYLKN